MDKLCGTFSQSTLDTYIYIYKFYVNATGGNINNVENYFE